MPTYIAISFTDIDRNIWIYNDNTMDNLTSGKGDVKVNYQCSLAGLNDIKLKLEITVRDANNQVLAFLPADEIPVIVLNRMILMKMTSQPKILQLVLFREMGSGVFLKRKGKFE